MRIGIVCEGATDAHAINAEVFQHQQVTNETAPLLQSTLGRVREVGEAVFALPCLGGVPDVDDTPGFEQARALER